MDLTAAGKSGSSARTVATPLNFGGLASGICLGARDTTSSNLNRVRIRSAGPYRQGVVRSSMWLMTPSLSCCGCWQPVDGAIGQRSRPGRAAKSGWLVPHTASSRVSAGWPSMRWSLGIRRRQGRLGIGVLRTRPLPPERAWPTGDLIIDARPMKTSRRSAARSGLRAAAETGLREAPTCGTVVNCRHHICFSVRAASATAAEHEGVSKWRHRAMGERCRGCGFHVNPGLLKGEIKH